MRRRRFRPSYAHALLSGVSPCHVCENKYRESGNIRKFSTEHTEPASWPSPPVRVVFLLLLLLIERRERCRVAPRFSCWHCGCLWRLVREIEAAVTERSIEASRWFLPRQLGLGLRYKLNSACSRCRQASCMYACFASCNLVALVRAPEDQC